MILVDVRCSNEKIVLQAAAARFMLRSVHPSQPAVLSTFCGVVETLFSPVLE